MLRLAGTSVWRPQSRYTMSRIECRIKFPQNQRCRAKIALHPPKSRCRTSLRTPLSHFPLIRSSQGARPAGGGYRGTFGFQKRIALQGGIAATVTPIALLCAAKFPRPPTSPNDFEKGSGTLASRQQPCKFLRCRSLWGGPNPMSSFNATIFIAITTNSTKARSFMFTGGHRVRAQLR